jgi:multicomponent Na+:H+ antiporter subunit A
MTSALLASFSMMGIIPLIGFIGKETVYSAILEVENFRFLLLTLAVISNAFVVTVTILVGLKPFFGQLLPTPKSPHEAPITMLIGPIVLSLFGLLSGLFPNVFIQKLLDQSTISILSEELGIKVKLWHGFNFVLLLSFITLLSGIGIYYFRKSIIHAIENIQLANFFKPSFWYEIILNGIISFARHQTNFLQNGYLRYYIIFILLTTLGLAGYALFQIPVISSLNINTDLTVYEIIIGIIIIASTLLVITSDSRLKAIVSLGVVGFAMGIIFILYSAPDLALTTFAIETLTVILFVLVLYKLPKYLKFSKPVSKTRDVIISLSVGLFMTTIVLLVTAGEMQSELKKYFAETSLPEGKGRNIVNVILVDFRAIDTLGEITVLAVAAIGVYALLKLRLKEGDK